MGAGHSEIDPAHSGHPVLLRSDTKRIKTSSEMQPGAAFFTAWGKNEPVINCLMDLDLASWDSLSTPTFDQWCKDVTIVLQKTFEYPSFKSIVAKAHVGKMKATKYLWSELPPDELDVTKHVSVHTEWLSDDAAPPTSHVLSKVAQLQKEYFDSNLPRWQVVIYRYVDAAQIQHRNGEAMFDYTASQTRAVFVLLRSGHMLADGISLTSMLLTSLFNESTCSEPEFPKYIPAVTDNTDSSQAAHIQALVGPMSSFEPEGDLQLACLDVEWNHFQTFYKDLQQRWDLRVTMTTLMQLVAAKALCKLPAMKSDSTIWFAMPRDERGAQFNRIKTSDKFRERAQEYAQMLKAGTETNLATGGAHKLQGLKRNGTSCDDWKDDYILMDKVLANTYMPEAQHMVDEHLSAKARKRATKLLGGTVDYMLSSINAGPQTNAFAGKTVSSLSVFVIPTCCYERSMMLMRSGNRMSVGVMADDAHLWLKCVQDELLSLQQLLLESSSSSTSFASSLAGCVACSL